MITFKDIKKMLIVLPDSSRTPFASFVSSTKERDNNQEDVSVSVEDQYRDDFLWYAMNGSYDDIKYTYGQYKAYRDFDKEYPDLAGVL